MNQDGDEAVDPPVRENEDLLSQDEAFEFLVKIGVENREECVSNDQLSFLNDIIAGFMTHIPFQSVSMLAMRREERRVPSLREVVRAGLSLEGGVCFTLNTFMCILLRALGLDAHVLDGSYTSSPQAHTHVVVLVKNLRYPDDDHIVDVGNGFPFLEAISLASLPVTFHQAGLEYAYTLDGDTVARLHRSGDHVPNGEESVMVADWRKVFHCSLTPVDYEFFYSHMKSIYIQEDSHFLQVLCAVRFPSPLLVSGEVSVSADTPDIWKPSSTENINVVKTLSNEAGVEGEAGARSGDDRVLLAIRNQSLLVGPMCQVVKSKVEKRVWPDLIKHYFPTIPSATVDLAVHAILVQGPCTASLGPDAESSAGDPLPSSSASSTDTHICSSLVHFCL